MTTDFLLYGFGFLSSVYFFSALLLILFGLSYFNDAYNKRISYAFFLAALAFVGFGFFNIFFQQVTAEPDLRIFSHVFLQFCAGVTPISVIIMVFISAQAFSLRSSAAYRFIKKTTPLRYAMYAHGVITTIALLVIDSEETSIILLLILFFLPVITCIYVSYISSLKRDNLLFLCILFVILGVGNAYAIYAMVAENFIRHPLLILIFNLFFAVVILFFGFYIMRYGYAETRAFFRLDVIDKHNISHAIVPAIQNKQFELYFQPQFDLKENLIPSAEALIRWNHPTIGNIPPDDFINVAEEVGVIDELTLWVIKTAINQAKTLLDAGQPLTISINFSATNLNDRIVTFLEKQLNRANLPAKYLHIEITETVLMQDTSAVLAVIEKIKALGVWIAIDDYGTGFSSLSYIQNLSPQLLKIDQAFVKSLSYTSDNYAIVYSTIQMARNMNIKTVAEGVESNHTMNLLAEIGCQYAQGYAIAKPMPFDEFTRWLTTHH